jgi:hypothetical protein
MKDVVLLAASLYLLKQDLMRVLRSAGNGADPDRSNVPASVG